MSNEGKSDKGKTGKKRILVVDDDRELLQMIGRALELEGYEVTTALNGNSGLAAMPKCKPHLVILDIMMPGLNGYETLAQIRQSSKVPVMMLTAVGMEYALEKSVDLGADRYVTKPFRIAELLAGIRALLRRTYEV